MVPKSTTQTRRGFLGSRKQEKNWFVNDGETTAEERIQASLRQSAAVLEDVDEEAASVVSFDSDIIRSMQAADTLTSEQSSEKDELRSLPSLASINSASLMSQSSMSSGFTLGSSVYSGDEVTSQAGSPRFNKVPPSQRRRNSAPKGQRHRQQQIRRQIATVEALQVSSAQRRSVLKSSAKRYQPDEVPRRESRWHSNCQKEGNDDSSSSSSSSAPIIPLPYNKRVERGRRFSFPNRGHSAPQVSRSHI